jgi:hypothetical protein
VLPQEVLTPPHVTDPGDEQEVPFVALQLLPVQLTVPLNTQFAVQVAFNGRGRFAAVRAGSSVCGDVGSPVTAGCPRMTAKAS